MSRRVIETGARAHQHERPAAREPKGVVFPVELAPRRPAARAPASIEPRYARVVEVDRRLREHAQRSRASKRRELLAVITTVAWCLLWLGALAWLLLTGAQAQRAASDVELLARIVVHETGWEDTGDAEAIFAVLTAGAARDGTSWQAFARRYSPRLHRGEVSRRWATELTESCRRPSSWPRVATVRAEDGSLTVRPHPGWGAYVDRCLAVMERVREVLSGERVHHCEREPHDWGGRVDRARARRLGLIEIDCSAGDVETVGDYYARPSLVGSEVR